MSDEFAYLGDGFNPRGLRKDQLRSILLTHGIKYSSDMLKPQLLELFNTEIVPRRAELRRKFVDVVASTANMERATPPPNKASKGRSISAGSAADVASEQAAELSDSEPPARIISPVRRGKPRKVRGSSARAGKSTSVDNSSGSEDEDLPEPPLSPRARRNMARKARVASETLTNAPSLHPPKHEKTEKPTAKHDNAETHAAKHAVKHETAKHEHAAKHHSDVKQEHPSPKAPDSPRRRRANRKVEVPTADAVALDTAPALSDIKLKAPRPTKRKATTEENPDDTSFVRDNVFQKTPSKRQRRDHDKPKPEIVPFLKGTTIPSAGPSSESQPSMEDFGGELELDMDIDLDEDLVEAMNADLDRFDDMSILNNELAYRESKEPRESRETGLKEGFQEEPIKPIAESLPEPAAEPVLEPAEPASEPAKPVSEPAAEPVSEPVSEPAAEPAAEPADPVSESAAESTPEPSERAPEPASQSAESAPEYKPSQDSEPSPEPSVLRSRFDTSSGTPRRRAFLPSLADMSVSRAFAEQLEPFLVPSPAPEPAKEDNEAAEQEAIPRRVSPEGPDISYLPDTESEAAREVYNMLDRLPRLPRMELPKMPELPGLPELPKLPDMPKLPELGEVPRLHIPRPHIPRPHIPRPHLPRFRLPRPHFPRINLRNRLPNRPHLPDLSQFVPRFSTIVYYIWQAFQYGLLLLVTVLAFDLFRWLRNEYSVAEYCGVGTLHFGGYPSWAEIQTNSDSITAAQDVVRRGLDQLRPNCISCPKHAQCYQGRVVLCDSGFQYTESSVSQIGLWPLSPSCQPDWELRRKLDVLGERAADILRQKRADVLCDDTNSRGNKESIVEASAMSSTELRDLLYARKSPLLADEEFEALWHQAAELLPSKYNDVYVVSVRNPSVFGRELTPQTNGNRTNRSITEQGAQDDYSHQERPELGEVGVDQPRATWFVSRSNAFVPIKCQLRQVVWGWYLQHRVEIQLGLGVVMLLVSIVTAAWLSKSRKMQDRKEAAKLIALLQQQRQRASEDPTGKTPEYLITTDLRRKHVSPAQWPRVQEIVEADDAVRYRHLEIHGEIHRVWDWSP